MLRYLLPLLVFAAITIFLWLGIGGDPTELPSPLLGKAVPSFELPALNQPDRTVDTDQLKGQLYLLNVWASWCSECRIEHPVITGLSEEFAVYGLNWKDQESDALRWLGQFGDPYRASAFDPDGRVGIDFGVYGAPETFLIDAQGVVRYKHVGPLTAELVSSELKPIIETLR